MQELYYRIVKGEELTDLELDDNFKRLKTAVDGLENQVALIVTVSGVPVGAIMPFAGGTIPNGYLWANGQAVSRTTYSRLFTALGTAYGNGDGSSTFNVPSLLGRGLMGANPMGGVTDGTLSTRTRGTYIGAETITLAHSHTGSGTVTINPVSVTPSGTIAINNYSGSVTPTISVTVNSVTLSATPEGDIVVNEAIAEITPAGTISVANHVNHTHSVTTDPFKVNLHEGGTDVALHKTYTTSNETPTLTHTGTFTGTPVEVVHDHTATFTGDAMNLNHTHTASGSSSAVSLNHGHTGTFTGSLLTFTPTGTVAVTANSASPSGSIINPTVICNFIIKY